MSSGIYILYIYVICTCLYIHVVLLNKHSISHRRGKSHFRLLGSMQEWLPRMPLRVGSDP